MFTIVYAKNGSRMNIWADMFIDIHWIGFNNLAIQLTTNDQSKQVLVIRSGCKKFITCNKQNNLLTRLQGVQISQFG